MNLKEEEIRKMVKSYEKGMKFACGDELVIPDSITSVKITRTHDKIFLDQEYGDLWNQANEGEDVTSKYLSNANGKSKRITRKVIKTTTKKTSDKVFIVHGRDHKTMKELKAMLNELGLNPIVLTH